MRELGMKAWILGILAIACVASPTLAVKTTYWTGGGGDALWTTPGNWSAGVPTSGSNDTVYIGTNGVAYTIDLTGSGSPNIKNNYLTIENATITNGTFVAYSSSSVGTGWIYCSNTWFANNAGIGGSYIPQTTLIKCRYNKGDGKYVENNVGSTSLTIRDPVGTHNDFGLYRVRADYSSNVSVTFDGGAYYLGQVLVNDSANANKAYLIITNGAVVREGANNPTTIGTAAGNGTAWVYFKLYEGSFETDDKMEFGPYMNLDVGPSGLRTIKYRAEDNTDYFRIRMTNEWQWDGEGLTLDFALRTANNTQTLEMCGQNLGAALTNFHDNYSIDRLDLIQTYGGTMQLIDAYTNNAGIAGSEVLYVDHIVLSNNFVIDFNNAAKIYYQKITTNTFTLTKLSEPAGGGLIRVTGASLSPTNGTIHPANAAAVTNGTPIAVGADYGTRLVSGFNAGAPVGIYLDVSGSQANIDALREELGAKRMTDDYDMVIEYTGVANGGDLFFDWNFSHRGVVLDNLKAGPPPPKGTTVVIR
jgi:hypothetical protein